MTKIQYSEKNEVLYAKVGVPVHDCHCENTRHASRSQQERRNGLRVSLLKTLLTVVAAFVLGSAIIVFCTQFYQRNYSFCGEVSVQDNLTASSPQCGNVPSGQRSDCWPQTQGASQQACVAKGCCWVPAEDSLGNIPWCYYPSNYQGYTVQSSKQTPTGMSYTLTRSTASGWPADVKTVALDVFYETQKRLRFKFYDPAHKRFEVPINVAPGPSHAPSTMDYQVQVPSSGPFSLKVTRKSTGKILFNTEHAAPLVFADQFLQLGSVLSTDFIYGLGEHRSAFKLNTTWTKFVMWSRDQPPVPNANLYGDHPFYLNIESDKNAHGVFLLNSNALGVELQPTPAVTFRSTGGILDFYVFSGPTSDSVVQQYTELVGRPFMPPFWSLGFHLCRWGYGGVDGMKKVISRMRSARMPYDTQWNDIDYMRGHLDWTYDSNGAFAGLPGVVDDLHAHGQHYIMIVDPGISNAQASGSYPPYDDGLRRNVFIKKPDGSGPIIGKVWPGTTAFPDFFHPNATDYWTNSAQSYHNQVKFDGMWIDMNEPSNFFDGSESGCPSNSLENPPYVPDGIVGGTLRSKTLCASSKHFNTTHYNLHMMYGYSETVASMSAMKTIRPGKRSIIISRSSFPNSGVHGGHWLGDNNAQWVDMYYSIPGMLNFQLFGIPLVGADICGFNGETNPELCARWMQLGAFYPFMRNHNSINLKDQDPAVFDTATQNIMRTALETRYSLLPFLYTLFYRSHVDGTAVIRPMFFQYPSSYNDATYILDVQFLWGSVLLITAATSPNTLSGQGYLPRDRWYDFYNHSFVDSPGHFINFALPRERINIQVRGGSVIPMQDPAVTTTLQRKNKFKLYVTLDAIGNADGELYWDDGEELGAPENGHYNLIKFLASKNTLQSAVLHGNYTAEPMLLGQVDILGIQTSPRSVQVNGHAYTQYTYKDKTLTITGLSVNLLQQLNIRWSL